MAILMDFITSERMTSAWSFIRFIYVFRFVCVNFLGHDASNQTTTDDFPWLSESSFLRSDRAFLSTGSRSMAMSVSWWESSLRAASYRSQYRLDGATTSFLFSAVRHFAIAQILHKNHRRFCCALPTIAAPHIHHPYDHTDAWQLLCPGNDKQRDGGARRSTENGRHPQLFQPLHLHRPSIEARSLEQDIHLWRTLMRNVFRLFYRPAKGLARVFPFARELLPQWMGVGWQS